MLTDLREALSNYPWILTLLVALVASLIAVVVHGIGARVAHRLARGRPLMYPVVRSCYVPSRVAMVAFALQFAWLTAPVGLPGLYGVILVTRLLFIAALTWLVARAVIGLGEGIRGQHPVDVADNAMARRIHTQTTVLVRTTVTAIGLAGVAVMLMTFPGVRQIGASLLASAGLVGIVAGFAARPVFGNLIAGMQIALAQPIAVDDVLIVEGEWGRVEEITGTYVVVRIWDERRLIVPLQWFIENPFQNWTRRGSQLIGSVFLWVDYRLPLDPLRDELKRLCEGCPEWDGRVCVLQVTDTTDRAIQLRALVSSQDSGRNWDLRCKVREGLVAFVQRNHPDCLPRLRAEMGGEPDRAGASTEPPRELSSPTV